MFVSNPIRFLFALITVFTAAVFAYLYYNQLHDVNEAIDLSAYQLGSMARVSYAWVLATGIWLLADARRQSDIPLGAFLAGGLNGFVGAVFLFTPLQWSGDFGAWAALPLMVFGAIGVALHSVTWSRSAHSA